jgi:hypothetical protein
VRAGTGRSGEVKTMTLHSLSRPLFLVSLRAAFLAIACSLAAPAPAADANVVPAHTRQVAAQGGVIQPVPIQAALDLLKWSPDHVPTIEVVEVRPPRVSPLAEGWTTYNGDGSGRPTIYVAGWSALYRAALANRLDAHFDVIRLAGVLAHERAHVEHGPNEELAYLAQLITLENLQARAVDIASVRRALDAVKRQKRGRPSDARDP